MCKTSNMGFIKIHRNIREWGWYDNANTFVVWVHLLIDANYEERTWHGEVVEVGSMITSTAKLAEEVGLSVKQIRTCLERLAKDGKIVVKGASKWTKITICNYDSYMLEGEDAGQTKGEQRASKGQAEGKQRATLKEDKNIRNEEIKKVSNDTKESKRFTKPTVEQINAYFQEIGFDESPNSFFDYYESKGWVVGNSPMKDWKAAARTWMHKRNKNGESLFPKESPSPQVPPGPPSPPPLRPYRDLLRMYPKEYMESDENYARRLVMIEERMKAEGEWCYEERPK